MLKALRCAWMVSAILLLAAQNLTAQGCQPNGGAITHPTVSFPGPPVRIVTISGNLNLIAEAPGACPNGACSFTYDSNISVSVQPATSPIAGELCLTAGLGTIPILCGPAPAGMLAPIGPGLYSAAFDAITLSAGCGETFEWTVRIWVDFGGVGGPLIFPVLTALLICGDC